MHFKAAILFFFVLCLPARANAQTTSCYDSLFARYSVSISAERTAPLNFSSNPRARHYKTTITQQYAEPANFAGHYSLAHWGCGINCRGIALIDRTTGRIVHYAPSLDYHDLDRREENYSVAFGFEARADSDIIIANPECDAELLELNKTAFDPTGPRAYRWDGNQFKLLCDLHYNEALATCLQ